MNKNDLIGVVADGASITKAQAGEAVDAVFDAITKSLKKGDEVRLVGFGTFSVSKRKASIGRNDFPMVMGVTVLGALFIAIANLVVDVAYAFLDPRVRYT